MFWYSNCVLTFYIISCHFVLHFRFSNYILKPLKYVLACIWIMFCWWTGASQRESYEEPWDERTTTFQHGGPVDIWWTEQMCERSHPFGETRQLLPWILVLMSTKPPSDLRLGKSSNFSWNSAKFAFECKQIFLRPRVGGLLYRFVAVHKTSQTWQLPVQAHNFQSQHIAAWLK